LLGGIGIRFDAHYWFGHKPMLLGPYNRLMLVFFLITYFSGSYFLFFTSWVSLPLLRLC